MFNLLKLNKSMEKKLTETTRCFGVRKKVNKFLLIMKLITFFLILGTLASSATSYSQVTKLDLRMRNSSVEEILKTIENSSEFIFIYDADLIKSLEKKSISVRGESVEEVLARLFDDEAVNYLIDDRQIFLFRKDVISQASVPETEEASIPPPQPKVISGSITDSQGDPLPGVNVLIKGTTTGTITDLNGRFQLSISPNDQILVISFIGMVTQEIPIGDRLVFNAIMEEDVVGFEEVVVVGYGVQRKESVVGAISVAQGEDIVRRGGVTNISSAITGLLPGVVTFNTVGKAGIDDAEILIRGKSTWNESAPLVLVDGVERNMNELDVNEVESISVLKDASATAVFGVRGANGIILITTKRGKTGKPVFNVSANTTLRTISKLPEYADSYTDLNFKNQSIELTIPKDNLAWGYYTPYEFLMHYKNQDMPYVFPDVDWQKETLRNSAISHKGLIDLRGGTEFVKYFTSLSYTYEGDIFRIEDFGQGYDPKNDLRRLNFRTNLDFQPTATTTFSVDIDGAYARIRDNSGSGWMNWNGLYGKAPYTHPVWHEDGTWGYNPVDDVLGVNPLHDFNFYGIRSRSRNDINATFRFDQKLNFITEGLSFQARVSTQNSYNTTGPTLDRNTQLKKYINPYTMEEESSATDNTTTGFNYLPDKSTTTTENPQTDVLRNLMYQTSLNYARRFGKHGFTGLLLFKRDERSLSDEFTAYREEWAGRITYDFDNRYLFETNAAYNGSEQFGPGYKFGFFPSYAVGWNVHNESFFSENVCSP